MKSIKKYNKNKQRLKGREQTDDGYQDEHLSHQHQQLSHHFALAERDLANAAWRPPDDVKSKTSTEINVCLDLTLISNLLIQQSKH